MKLTKKQEVALQVIQKLGVGSLLKTDPLCKSFNALVAKQLLVVVESDDDRYVKYGLKPEEPKCPTKFTMTAHDMKLCNCAHS